VRGSLASNSDLGPVERARGAQRRVVVRALVLPEPSPDARGVHEPPGGTAQFDEFVHRVPGGAGHWVDQGSLVAGQLVQQAGLADVRAADQGHPARPALGVTGVLGRVGQRVEYQVEQVAAAAPVQRTDRGGLAQAERPQRRDLGFGPGVVDLVGRDHDRLARTAQHAGHRRVRVGHPHRGVHHEQHRVGGVHRHPGLGGHPGSQARLVLRPLAAGRSLH